MMEDTSYLVGICWMVSTAAGARLLTAACPLSEGEPYGDCVGYGPGHYRVWQGWRKSRALDAAVRAVVCDYEYEDWPRGRIVFDRARDRFILYCDRKLMAPKIIEQIQTRFHLPADRTTTEADFHYQSRETPHIAG